MLIVLNKSKNLKGLLFIIIYASLGIALYFFMFLNLYLINNMFILLFKDIIKNKEYILILAFLPTIFITEVVFRMIFKKINNRMINITRIHLPYIITLITFVLCYFLFN